jgi:hypothetical protein
MASDPETSSIESFGRGAQIQAGPAQGTADLCAPCSKAFIAERWTVPKILRWFMLLLAFTCVGMVASIEILNAKVGYRIEKKSEQEPDSKWRIGAPRSYFLRFEEEFRAQRDLGRDHVFSLPEKEELRSYSESRWLESKPGHILDLLMAKYSYWGIPVGLLLALSFFKVPRERRFVWRGLCIACSVVGVGTFLISTFRYFPSLGW